MFWKEMVNQPEDFLNDPKNVGMFSLKSHPEYPALSALEESVTFNLLKEFVSAEGQPLTIQSLLNYSPFVEMILRRQNHPSFFS